MYRIVARSFLAAVIMCGWLSVARGQARQVPAARTIQGVRGQAVAQGWVNFRALAATEKLFGPRPRLPRVAPDMIPVRPNPRRGPAVSGEPGLGEDNDETPAERDKPAPGILAMRGLQGMLGPGPNPPPPPLGGNILTDFQGNYDIFHFIPPDTHGAVGPNHVVSVSNDQVRILDRSGNELSVATLNGFFSSLPEDGDLFDEKIIYDPFNHHFIFEADDTDNVKTYTMLAVSQTDDPTGNWKLFKVNADEVRNGGFYDYPSVGLNHKWFVCTGNIYPWQGGNMYANVQAYDLADLYDFQNGTAKHTTFSDDSGGFTLQPTFTYDNTTDTIYFIENWNDASGQVRMSTLTGPAATPTLTVGVAFPQMSQGWTLQPDAPQAGSSTLVATNDEWRPMSAVYRDGHIWFAHCVSPLVGPARASIQWAELDTSGNVIQDGLIDDPTGYNFFYFPSIAVNKNHDAMIGFTKSSPALFPGCYFAFRVVTDPPGAFSADQAYKLGERQYESFGIRWGDYSQTVPDPLDDTTFWTVQEYSTNLTNSGFSLFGTWWAHLAAIPPPIVLSVSPATVFAGDSSTGTVVLDKPAGVGGQRVNLVSSDTTVAQVPDYVTVPQSQTTITFPVSTSPDIAGVQSSTITATRTDTGDSASASITAKAFIANLFLSADGLLYSNSMRITGGYVGYAYVELSQAAPQGGVVVNLASADPSVAQVMPSITVPAGQTDSPVFYVWTVPTVEDTPVPLQASAHGNSLVSVATVLQPVPYQMVISPPSVTGGASSAATVYLTGPTPADKVYTLDLSSSDGAAIVQTPFVMQPSKSYSSFTIRTTQVTSTHTATITASRGSTSVQANLKITGAGISSFTLSPSTVGGGGWTTGTVLLARTAPAGGLPITLSKGPDPQNAVGTLPSVTVPAGSTYVSFSIPTKVVSATSTVAITARDPSGGTKTANLTVQAAGISSVTLMPTVIHGGTTATGRVFLSAPAPSGGAVVTLTSTAGPTSVPSSVTVPAGQTTASFVFRAPIVTGYTSYVVTATYNGVRGAGILVIP